MIIVVSGYYIANTASINIAFVNLPKYIRKILWDYNNIINHNNHTVKWTIEWKVIKQVIYINGQIDNYADELGNV